jgi:hypothetical protein
MQLLQQALAEEEVCINWQHQGGVGLLKGQVAQGIDGVKLLVWNAAWRCGCCCC